MPQNDSTSPIGIGDWVMLKSGSPPLCVFAVYEGRANVIGPRSEHWVPIECLVLTAFDSYEWSIYMQGELTWTPAD